MDPTASSRRPPAGRTRDQPIIAQRGDEPGTKPGESESSSGCGFHTQTPPQENGAEPETGCRRQYCAARGETGGDSRAAPESTDCIDPASRSGTRRPSGAGHHVDAATTVLPQSICGDRGGDSRAAPESTDCIDPASRSGTRRPSGAGHHVDAATTVLPQSV